jgi:cell division protein FtsB
LLLRRLAWLALILGALTFAVQGGEYSTLDLLHQRRQRRELVRSIDSLTKVVDSLRTYRTRLQRDPKLQERVAREVFGMVRGDKELLYRFVEPSAAKRDSVARPR